MAIPVADALCDWVRPGHSCCRHDHTRNCVNKSAARDEKVNALLVSAGGGTCAAQKRTGGGREGAKNGMLLCASTGISCLHIVTESGHVGAAFCDPKVAHGHIVYAAPHVLDCGVPPGFVELNARALARGVKGEVAPWSDCAQRAYVLYEVALGLGPGLVRDRNREIGLGFGLWLGLPPTALSRQSRRSLAYSRPSTPYRRSRACSAAGTH